MECNQRPAPSRTSLPVSAGATHTTPPFLCMAETGSTPFPAEALMYGGHDDVCGAIDGGLDVTDAVVSTALHRWRRPERFGLPVERPRESA